MSTILKQTGKMAAIMEMKEPGSIKLAEMPKALYNQAWLELLHKKDSLHTFLVLCRSNNISYLIEEICEELAMEKSEYDACYQALVREGRI